MTLLKMLELAYLTVEMRNMLLLKLKLWVKRFVTHRYYANNNVNRAYMMGLLLHVKTIGYLYKYMPGDKVLDAEHFRTPMQLLGHYVLSGVAEISKRAYDEVVTSAPLHIQADSNMLLVWVGMKANDVGSVALSNYDFIRVTTYRLYGVKLPDDRAIPSGKQTVLPVTKAMVDLSNTFVELLETVLRSVYASLAVPDTNNASDLLRRKFYLMGLVDVIISTYEDPTVLHWAKMIKQDLANNTEGWSS